MPPKKSSATIPYTHAASGQKARLEVISLLRQFECDQIGFMDDFNTHSVILAFIHKDRKVQITASAIGWAKMYLAAHPWTSARKTTEENYQRSALKQGLVAVNSMLRDWVKGQVTMIECGLMTFEHAFAAHMLTADGKPLLEAA